MNTEKYTVGIRRFLERLEDENKSQSTIKGYVHAVWECAEYFGEQEKRYPLKNLTTKDIDAYLIHLQDIGQYQQTRSKKWSGLQKYFGFLEATEVIDEGTSPEKSIAITVTEEEAEQEVHYLTDEEDVKRIRQYLAEKPAETPFQRRMKLRNIAIVEVLLHTGCRASELLALKWDDIEWDDEKHNKGVIKVYNQKTARKKKRTGTNYRFVWFNSRMSSCLSDYYDERKIGKPHRIFDDVSHYNTLRKIVKEIGDAVDLPWLTPHDFRHYFATYLARNGFSVNDIANAMGDSPEVVMSTYIHLDSKHSASIFKNSAVEI